MRPKPRPLLATPTAAGAASVVFAPLDAPDLKDLAARRIAEAIGLGLLEVGDRLPPEAELADRFGIAPMTLREGLAQLREAGYIETRPGRGGGTFVCSALPSRIAAAHAPLGEQPSLADIRDLTDAREAVEGAAAALAAQRASSVQIDELQQLVDTMANTADYPDFRLLDSRFHVTLSLAGGSRRLTEFVTRVHTDLRDHFARWPNPLQALGITNGQHRAILAAVTSGDAELARARMVSHVRFTSDYMIQAASAVASDTTGLETEPLSRHRNQATDIRDRGTPPEPSSPHRIG